MKKKIVFIVNPVSGTGRKKTLPSMISRGLDRDRFDYSIVYTERAGQATELAKQAVAEGTDIVVAVGGDGTINEVARSLVNTNTALGIIPCGSGNGLARHLTIPLSASRAIKIINNCEIHDLDYGKINGMPFFCTCGMGFDAVISMKFSNAGKRGATTYWENVLKEVVNYKPEVYKITDERGSMTYKAFLITCANASQWGNNAFIAPHASMSDGLMDVIVAEPFTAIEAPELGLQLFSKAIDRNSRIKAFRSKKILIRREQEGVIHFDGDPVMAGKDVVIEMVNKGIKVVVNPDKHDTSHQNVSLLDAYAELVNNFYDVRDDIAKTNRRLQALNKYLKIRINKTLKEITSKMVQ